MRSRSLYLHLIKNTEKRISESLEFVLDSEMNAKKNGFRPCDLARLLFHNKTLLTNQNLLKTLKKYCPEYGH